MSRSIVRKVTVFLVIPVVLIGIFSYVDFRLPIFQNRTVESILAVFHLNAAPCAKPIEYSIGTFDPRFNISKDDFLTVIQRASKIWGRGINRNLLAYSPRGALKINLIYDYRQKATDTLRKLGYSIENTKESYDKLKSQYDSLQKQYRQDKDALRALEDVYKSDQAAYNEKVSYWNSLGGAPPQEYRRLGAEAADLKTTAHDINAKTAVLNKLADTINAMADTLNRLASDLNGTVARSNGIINQRGEEFQEGEYVSDSEGEYIDIYEFMDKQQLIRVLAHELGHALGLEHVNDPNAIMYYLNQSKNATLTAADLTELRQRCGIGQ